jgi:2',3'-cyclic-nucleotide 2'-phosphodiesterase (5'-nucleotidase family)
MKYLSAFTARILGTALLILAGIHCVLGQAAPRPAPQPSPTNDVRVRANETLVDASLDNDPAVDKMVAVYSPKVRELDAVIGFLKGDLRKGGAGAGSLGNFVTDGMRIQGSLKLGQPIDVAIVNSGGLRRSAISEGDLHIRDIFELLPFENALVTLELTGEQLTELLNVVTSGREAQSGARVVYFTKPDKTTEIVSVKLRDANKTEIPIDPKATYRVVTIDYLVTRGGDRFGIFQQGKNLKPLGLTLRDSILDYVKAETAAGRQIRPNLDGRFAYDRTKSNATEEVSPQ